jgi:hypothetical protein
MRTTTISTHLQVRRIADGALVRDLPLDKGLTAASWSLDHDRVVVTATAPDGSGATRLGVLDTAGRTIARACSPAAGSPYIFAIAAPRLLARAGTGLRVYDSSGEPVGPLLGAGEGIGSAALSPDGNWVAWATSDALGGSQVVLVNASTGEVQPIGDPAVVYSQVTPSSGGQLVALRNAQTTLVSVIDVASQATLAQPDGSLLKESLISFSADSTALIYGDSGSAQAVDWRTGAALPPPWPSAQALPPAAQAFMNDDQGCVSGQLPFAIFSADGSRAAVGVGCGREFATDAIPDTDLYDVASGTLLQAFPNPSAGPPLLSPDGSVITFDDALWCR